MARERPLTSLYWHSRPWPLFWGLSQLVWAQWFDSIGRRVGRPEKPIAETEPRVSTQGRFPAECQLLGMAGTSCSVLPLPCTSGCLPLTASFVKGVLRSRDKTHRAGMAGQVGLPLPCVAPPQGLHTWPQKLEPSCHDLLTAGNLRECLS